MSTTAIPIDDEIVSLIRERGADPRRELEESIVLELFRLGEISRGRASKLLGLDLLSFLRLASSHQIQVLEL